jgi:hypothetical protein
MEIPERTKTGPLIASNISPTKKGKITIGIKIIVSHKI